MFKYFPNKNPFYIIKNFFLVLILISGIIFPQTKTNLEVFYSLNDSLVNRIAEDIPQNNDKIILTLNLGNSYSIFSNHIKNDFIKKGKEIFTIPPGELNLTEINIVLEEVDLHTVAKKKIKQFSKGMKQRMKIAQALLHKPKLIIADEPFNGLDPLIRRNLFSLFENYREDYDTTFFISSLLRASGQCQ